MVGKRYSKMKLLAILVVAFSLSGCLWQSVNNYDMMDAIKLCGSLENVAYINAAFSSDERVTCMNGKNIYYTQENNMTKFKVGDKLRCIEDTGWCGAKKGSIWTFDGYYYNDSNFVKFRETKHISNANDSARNWELVDSSVNLMPELTSGMRVELRTGAIYIIVKDLGKFFDHDGFMELSSYDQTGKLIENAGDYRWDIVKIYSDFLDLNKLGKVIWEEFDPIKQAKQKRIDELTEIILSANKELESLSEN